MKILKFVFILFLLSTPNLNADPGSTGLRFLLLGDGARAVGMGEAQAALAESAQAIYWNPSGLGLTRSHDLLLSHLQHFEDSTHQYMALARPIKEGRLGGIGISITRFSIDNIESRDAENTLLGQVKQEDLSLQVAYGFRLGSRHRPTQRDGLFLGLGLKQVSEKLAGVSDSVFAGDVGAQYRPGEKMEDAFGHWIRRVSFGVASVNIGSDITFDKEGTKLPQETRLGLGYTHFLWGDALTIGVDLRNPRDEDAFLSAGAEFWVINTLALRLGYIDRQDIGENIRAGAGFRFKTIQLDYAWSGFDDQLGDSHRFSIQFLFGKNASPVASGLKTDLVAYHLSKAQEALDAGAFHEAVLHANQVLSVESKNPQALQILFQAGKGMKPQDPLPKTPKFEPREPAIKEPVTKEPETKEPETEAGQ